MWVVSQMVTFWENIHGWLHTVHKTETVATHTLNILWFQIKHTVSGMVMWHLCAFG